MSVCLDPSLLMMNMCLYFVHSLSVFNQGEEGTSWYIIQKGSVNVVIYGKVWSSQYSFVPLYVFSFFCIF